MFPQCLKSKGYSNRIPETGSKRIITASQHRNSSIAASQHRNSSIAASQQQHRNSSIATAASQQQHRNNIQRLLATV
jgi:hypothetical protein